MPQGNGTPTPDVPFPRRPPAIDTGLRDAMKRVDETVEHRAVTPPAPAEPIHDFVARVDDAAQLLINVGNELGTVGNDDMHALQKFADTMQASTRRYIGQLIERKRRELADLERILGKL